MNVLFELIAPVLILLSLLTGNEAVAQGETNPTYQLTQEIVQPSLVPAPGGDSLTPIGLHAQYGVLVRRALSGVFEMYGVGGWVEFNEDTLRKLAENPERYQVLLNPSLITEAIRVSGIGVQDARWLKGEAIDVMRRIDTGRKAYEQATGVSSPIWTIQPPVSNFTILSVPAGRNLDRQDCSTYKSGRRVSTACPN
jgi:hypothetical protein